MAVPGSPTSGNPFPVPMAHLSTHFITTAAALRLSNFLGHYMNRRLRLSSSALHFQNTSPRFGCFDYLRDMWSEEVLHLQGLTCLHFATSYFGRGNEYSNATIDMMKGYSNASRRRVSSNGRRWTNFLLAANVLMFIATCATKGRLLHWGGKINTFIDKGQLWRLVTAAFLHGDPVHLLLNCQALNYVGPAIEQISGPSRFLAVYFTSAIAGCGMSYWLNERTSAGASGAIYGLAGSLAICTLRHKDMVKDGKRDLQNVLSFIALNMVVGVVVKRIDNWMHVGGLLGGTALSWLLGPALKLECVPGDGQQVLVDRAPIFTLTRNNKMSG